MGRHFKQPSHYHVGLAAGSKGRAYRPRTITRRPGFSGDQVVEALERTGFIPVRHEGSRMVLHLSTGEGDISCVVPLFPLLTRGHLLAIKRQLGDFYLELRENLVPPAFERHTRQRKSRSARSSHRPIHQAPVISE